MSREEFDRVFDYIGDHFFWLDPYEEPTLENILGRAKQFVQRRGIKQLVIDPFNSLEHKRDRNETGSEYVGRFLDELSRFAKRYGVLVHLVAHPTSSAAAYIRRRHCTISADRPIFTTRPTTD